MSEGKLTLDPKVSKNAKAFGKTHGHTFGRLTVKGDKANAVCKTDGCLVVLEVTADDFNLVPDDNGVISCVTESPRIESFVSGGNQPFAQSPPMTTYALVMEEPEWVALSETGANALLMGGDFSPPAEVDSSDTDSPFALTLPPAPAVSPDDLMFANGEPWNPERDLIDAIETAIVNHPRSQQTLIGPSEIGTECDRCLAKKLLGIPKTREVAWLPQVGTAVHDWLDGILTECDDCGWITERRVTVGIVGNRVIRGRCDAFKNGVVVDFKVVGQNTMRNVKAAGPSNVYRVQSHLYGRGYELDGHDVAHVALLYLPRNEPTLAASQFHIEPYDRDIALAALDRAERIYDFVSAQQSNILELQRHPDCYDCYRFAPLPGEDSPSTGPHAGQPFAGIL